MVSRRIDAAGPEARHPGGGSGRTDPTGGRRAAEAGAGEAADLGRRIRSRRAIGCKDRRARIGWRPAAVAAEAAGDGGRAEGRGGLISLAGLGALVLISVVVAVVIWPVGRFLHAVGTAVRAATRPVPTNQVTGSGNATVHLNGDVATVTVETPGCSTGAARDAHTCGRSRRMSASVGGAPAQRTPVDQHDRRDQVLRTTAGVVDHRGDTSPKSIVVFARYPTVGKIHYTGGSRFPRASPERSAPATP